MRRLAAADRRPTAWKNGGGITTEIAAHPPGAGLSEFDWRVSLADVAADGPFSAFPGIERTLVLLAGAGMTLAIDGAGEVPLTVAAPACRFPGDATVAAALHDGPIRDLNVMSRRDRYAHTVERFVLAGVAEVPAAAAVLAIAPDGGVVAGDGTVLSPWDAVLAQDEPLRLDAAAAPVILIRFTRAG